jgi:hypothetical protein
MGPPESTKDTPRTATQYLDYLSLEMSIMGILSTFCVATVALAVDRVGNVDLAKPTLLQQLVVYNSPYFLAGSAWLLVAALGFYRQRSKLATLMHGTLALAPGVGAAGHFRRAGSTLVDPAPNPA